MPAAPAPTSPVRPSGKRRSPRVSSRTSLSPRPETPIGSIASADRPIGVFDSGVGGLSVLKALRAELPQEDFVYFADTGNAPYGERSDAFVIGRSQAIAQQLRQAHGIKALVVACNTATAAAVHLLRADHPDLLIVG